MKHGRWWGVFIVLVGISIGTVYTTHVVDVQTTARSPYGLSHDACLKVQEYFALAAEHHEYEMTAAHLRLLLREKKPLLLIDVRQPEGKEGFYAGHIKGAHNIPLQWMGQELLTTHAETELLPFPTDAGENRDMPITFFGLPRHQPIVVMCYDGNGGEMIPALLRILGYQAYSLKEGVSMWNASVNVWPTWHGNPLLINWPMKVGRGITESSESLVSVTSDVIGEKGTRSIAAMLSSMSRTYPTGYSFPWTIEPNALAAELAGAHPPIVVDLREASQYRAGHIAGSINIPFGQLGSNMQRLDATREIVLVSQSLQRSAQANGLLRLLGYHSYVLKQGLAAWNHAEDHVPPPHHYPLQYGR